MRGVSTFELATLGEDVTDSRTLTQRFFHYLNFSYKLQQEKTKLEGEFRCESTTQTLLNSISTQVDRSVYAGQTAERLRTHR